MAYTGNPLNPRELECDKTVFDPTSVYLAALAILAKIRGHFWLSDKSEETRCES